MARPGGRRISAQEVAALTGGRLVGPTDVAVAAVAPLERAGPGELSFLAGSRHLPYFRRSAASLVLCRAEHEGEPLGPRSRVVVGDPQAALLAVLPVLYPEPEPTRGVHPTATIGAGARWEEPVTIGPGVALGAGARLGRNVRIGPGCAIGEGVTIGDDALLHANVVCYAGTEIGRRVILHAGVVVGADGFGFAPAPVAPGGTGHRKIPHVGRCRIGDDVEIGANSTIDRGSVDDTVIGDGSKIDNLVHVGHNVHLGQRVLIMAQVGIAGSTQIEDDVIIAGQAGVKDHVVIGRGARLGGRAAVIGDVPAGATVSGYPARDHRQSLRAQAALFRLAAIVDDLEALAKGAHGGSR